MRPLLPGEFCLCGKARKPNCNTCGGSYCIARNGIYEEREEEKRRVAKKEMLNNRLRLIYEEECMVGLLEEVRWKQFKYGQVPKEYVKRKLNEVHAEFNTRYPKNEIEKMDYDEAFHLVKKTRDKEKELIKEYLGNRDGLFCFYCRTPSSVSPLLIEHYINEGRFKPKYEDSWELSNLRLACSFCNRAKYDRSPLSYSEWILPKKESNEMIFKDLIVSHKRSDAREQEILKKIKEVNYFFCSNKR